MSNKKYKKYPKKNQNAKPRTTAPVQNTVDDVTPVAAPVVTNTAPVAKPAAQAAKLAADTQNAAFLQDDKRTRLHINFIGKRRIYYAISISLIVIGVLVSVIFGVNLDIQFKGGAIIKYSYSGTIDKNAAQAVAADTITGKNLNISAQIDTASGGKSNRLVLQLGESISSTQQQALFDALKAKFPDSNITTSESNDVSPEMGREFFMKSLGAVLLASLLIVIYIWIRFRRIGGLPAGLTAFIALIHDVLMAFVAFSIFRIPINDNFIAVSLTIIGYSINDTIVIYDRIRENRKLYGGKVHFKDIVNLSINQSFARSINTTLVTVMALAVLCVVSVVYNLDSVRSFALPMMIGVVSGCYSTICIAGPLWVTWVTHKEKKEAALKAAKKLRLNKA